MKRDINNYWYLENVHLLNTEIEDRNLVTDNMVVELTLTLFFATVLVTRVLFNKKNNKLLLTFLF